VRFEIYEPFISLIFKYFSGCGKQRITETTDTESADKGAHLYLLDRLHFMELHKVCPTAAPKAVSWAMLPIDFS
jgi:hypothetical protein